MRVRIFSPLITLAAIALGVVLGGYPQILGGDAIGPIARGMPTLMDPAPYAFSIWLVIFAGQLLFGMHQMLPSQWDNPLYRRIRIPAAINSLTAGAWSVAYSHHDYFVAWMCMLATLATLAFLVSRLGKPTGPTYAFGYLTYHANLAWISVATMVNTAQFFHYQLQWGGQPLTPMVWAVILVLVAAIVAVLMLLRDRDVVFALVIAWALVAIGIEQQGVFGLPVLAYVLASVLALGAVGSVVRTPLPPRMA